MTTHRRKGLSYKPIKYFAVIDFLGHLTYNDKNERCVEYNICHCIERIKAIDELIVCSMTCLCISISVSIIRQEKHGGENNNTVQYILFTRNIDYVIVFEG